MGNILSCCWKSSASPNASPRPEGHSVQVNQVADDSDVCDPSTRKSVAVPPAIAVLEYVELGDLDFEEGQPVLRMSDLKMPAGKETPGVFFSPGDLCPNDPRIPEGSHHLRLPLAWSRLSNAGSSWRPHT